MAKLSLDSTLTREGKFKGQPLKTLVDQSWYQFQNWYRKWPDMFTEDVHEYVREISLSLGRNHIHDKEIRTRVQQKNS